MENLSEIYALLNSKNEANVQLGLTVWSGIDKASYDTFVSEWQAWADVNQMSLTEYLAEYGMFVASCWCCRLTTMPTIPNGTKVLDCYRNQLTELPTLPESLIELLCWDNQIAQLPTLPASLVKLSCGGNQIAELPTLPESLVKLDCSDNRLTAKPTVPDGCYLYYGQQRA